MSICKKCGQPVEDNAKFCPACGAKQGNEPVEEVVTKKFKEFFTTTDHTAEYDPTDVNANKGMALLSYIGPLVLVPIFGAKNAPFVRFHANQGLVLFICEALWTILYHFLRDAFGSGVLYGLMGVIGTVVDIVAMALVVFGIFNVIKGKAKELPLIGKYQLLK